MAQPRKKVTAKRQRVRRLTAFRKNGKIKVNPLLRGEDRRRVIAHMKTFRKARLEGNSFSAAYRKALDKEHAGMTQHQVQVYEGRLGAVARWHPMHWKSAKI